MTDGDLIEAVTAALEAGPARAGDIAGRIGVRRSEVNPILYRRTDLFENDGDSPPTWRLIRVDVPRPSLEQAPRSKSEAMQAILKAVGSGATLTLGPGSTEPKELFLEVDRHLALGLDHGLSKVALARRIVAEAGDNWPQQGDSTSSPSGGGDTVTHLGLLAVLRAAERLADGPRRPSNRKAVPERASPGVPYVEAAGGVDAPATLVELDWDDLDRATRAHAGLQNAVAELVRDAGLEPLSPASGGPRFDIAWAPRGRFVVCEVKSATPENARQQARLGLGQVLDYRAQLRQVVALDVLAVLVMTLAPPTSMIDAALSAGVRIASSEELPSHLDPLL